MYISPDAHSSSTCAPETNYVASETFREVAEIVFHRLMELDSENEELKRHVLTLQSEIDDLRQDLETARPA